MPIPHLSRALVMEVASGPHCSLTVSAQNEKGQDQAVRRITTAGAVTPYRIPAAISDAFEYCLGPADRLLWFTDQSVTPRLIGRITSPTAWPRPITCPEPSVADSVRSSRWPSDRTETCT